MTVNQAGGRMELVCGPMFAGKTTTLIERLTAAREAGETVIVVKPARDTRYGAERIVTHDGVALDARPIRATAELIPAVATATVLGIDEAHFFDASLAEECQLLSQRGVRVIVAGVDLDHRGRWFDVMAALRKMADEVTCVEAVCTRCGAPARFTQRLVAGDERIIIGGAGDYEPRCERCFQPSAQG